MGNFKLKIVLTVIMLVFSIIPAVVVGAIGTFSIMGYERSVKENTLQRVSESKSAAVKQLFNGYLSVVRATAKSETAVEAANGGGSAAGMLSAAVSANPDFLDMMILDAGGTVVEAVNGTAGGVFENLPMNDQGVINMPSVSEMLTWTSYGDAIFVADAIPSDTATGEAGYVAAIVSVGEGSGLMNTLNARFDGLTGGHFMLVDKNGVAVNFSGNGQINRDFTTNALNGSMSQFFDSSSSGYSDLKNSSDIKSLSETAGGYTYYLGLIDKSIMNWRWAGIAENSSFNSFSLTTNLFGWVVVVASAVVFSVCSLVVIGRFLGNMNGMLKTMTEISNAEGATDIRFKVTNRKSELGQIQTSFNDLLDEVFLSEERHRTIAELSDNMLFEWDFHKERMYASPNMLAKFDINTEEATLSNGKFIDSLMEQEDAEKYKRDINQLLKNKNGYSAEYQLRTKSGAVIWVSLRANCVTDRLGEPLRVIGVMTDIDNEKKLELQLSERASYDFLSQLYNRNTFIRNLTSEVERRGTKRVAVLFIDVDDFKFINDRYGHTVGDDVIRFVADTIRKKVDDRGGFAGRFGGDEFVLCFTNQEDIDNIESISMDIINELYSGYDTADGSMHIDVKASIGVAFCPDHTEDVNELLSFADTAMYFVKKNGKTNYHIYIPEDSATDEYIDPEGF